MIVIAYARPLSKLPMQSCDLKLILMSARITCSVNRVHHIQHKRQLPRVPCHKCPHINEVNGACKNRRQHSRQCVVINEDHRNGRPCNDDNNSRSHIMTKRSTLEIRKREWKRKKETCGTSLSPFNLRRLGDPHSTRAFFIFFVYFHPKFCACVRLYMLTYWQIWWGHASIPHPLKYTASEDHHNKGDEIAHFVAVYYILVYFPFFCIDILLFFRFFFL